MFLLRNYVKSAAASVAVLLCACGAPEAPAKKTTTFTIDQLETIEGTPDTGLVVAVPAPDKHCRTLLVKPDSVQEIGRFEHTTLPCYEAESFTRDFMAMVYADKHSVWVKTSDNIAAGPISHTVGRMHHPAYNHTNDRVYYWLEEHGTMRLLSSTPGGAHRRTERTDMRPGTRFRFVAGHPVPAHALWSSREQKAAVSSSAEGTVSRDDGGAFHVGTPGVKKGKRYRVLGPFRDFTPKVMLPQNEVLGATATHLVAGTLNKKSRTITTRKLSKLAAPYANAAEADFVVNPKGNTLYFTATTHSEYDNHLFETRILRVKLNTGTVTVVARLLGDYGATAIGYIK